MSDPEQWVEAVRRGQMTRRQLLRSGILAGLSLPAIATLLAACGSTSASGSATTASASKSATAAASSGGPVHGGTLKVGLDSDATTLDPDFTTAQVDGEIYRSIYDRLIDVDDKMDLVPMLATEWSPVNDKLWEFKLRQGVKFHDGTAFDAAAAKANFDRMLNPKNGSPRRGEIPYVTQAEVVDSSTLRLHLDAPFAPLPFALTGDAGIMISPAAIQKYGRKLASNPVGSGPFQFVEWKHGDYIQCKAFPDYWQKGRPYLGAVRYQGIPDPQVKEDALRTGSIDIAYDFLPKDISSLKQESGLHVYAQPSFSVISVRLQSGKAPFNNKALREAVSWAIDRNEISKIIYFGQASPGRSFLPPTVLGYDASYDPYPKRDLTKAKAKLKEGGQPNGFTFTAQILNDPTNTQLGQAIAQQLSDIGVTMKLVTLDNGTLLSRLVAGNFIATVIQFYGGRDPFEGFSRFFWSKSRLDIYGYRSATFDSLLQQAAGTSNVQARTALYTKLNEVLGADLPWIFLAYPYGSQAYRSVLNGYTFVPDGGMRFADAWLAKA